jgi:hypothetical protein
MGVKITKNFKGLLNLPKDISKNFSRRIKASMEAEIVGQIISGKSPVRSHKFKEYSDKYAIKKGAKRPVNFLESGKMLETTKISQEKGTGKISIEITSEIAKHHNSGKGNNPLRKLLPTKKGEKFNIHLTRFLNKMLLLAVKKVTKKQR